MKPVLFLLILFMAACNNHAQPVVNKTQSVANEVVVKHIPNTLASTTWLSDGLIGLSENGNSFTLRAKNSNRGKFAGNITSFTDSVHYESYYTAWCGNDCFTRVYGSYSFTDTVAVEFKVDSIQWHGECTKPTEYLHGKNAGIFSVQFRKDSLLLKKL